jgi:CRP-like cAMP-binding protein
VSSNKLLACLSRADSGLLAPHLCIVELPFGTQLQASNKRVTQVYFLDSGIASIVAKNGRPIEVGMIGREGMTGITLLLDSNDPVPHEIYMQVAGRGQRLSASALRKAISESDTLHRVLLRNVHKFLAQITQTAMANGRNKIEERLARWLLMAHDRTDGDDLVLTHEILAVMLGVQRPGVTTAMRELVGKGLISHRRALVTIIDRQGLEETANGSYVRRYSRLSCNSFVRAWTSSNSPTLLMAITAWSAKVCRRAICLSKNGCTRTRGSPVCWPMTERGRANRSYLHSG